MRKQRDSDVNDTTGGQESLVKWRKRNGGKLFEEEKILYTSQSFDKLSYNGYDSGNCVCFRGRYS